MKRVLMILLCSLLLTACTPKAPMPTIAPSAPPATNAPTDAPTEAPLITFTLYHGDDNAESSSPRRFPFPKSTRL